MMPTVRPEDLAAYGQFVQNNLGLHFAAGDQSALREGLQARLHQLSLSSSQKFTARLHDPAVLREEVAAAAQTLTIGETYFYRYPEQFNAMAEVALPTCWQERPLLQILSAGCSTGEEAYTLGMLAMQHPLAQKSYRAEVLGVDVNADVLAKARLGRYNAWSFRQDLRLTQSAHVQSDGKGYAVSSELRNVVRFAQANLNNPQDTLWASMPFDIIFCRNVLIYFDAADMAGVLQRLRGLLRPGGFLFLGHAESMRGASPETTLHHSHDCFYYQRLRSGAPPPAEPMLRDWMDRIGSSQQRLATLKVAAPQVRAQVSPPPKPEMPSVKLDDDMVGHAMQLFQQERFADALKSLEAVPDQAGSLQAWQLRAAILTNGGRFSEAVAVCEKILACDSLHAGAYCLLTLCREQTGDHRGALDAARLAASLDTHFAMPRLHAARLLQKAGLLPAACEALRQAERLLQSEDTARLALFGGGFSRAALLDLCRRELRACGGTP